VGGDFQESLRRENSETLIVVDNTAMGIEEIARLIMLLARLESAN
jgi:hypothetical protein